MRHKHGEIAVFNTKFLDLGIKKVLDGFPNGIRPGTKNIAATYIIVFNQFWFCDDLFKRKTWSLRPKLNQNYNTSAKWMITKLQIWRLPLLVHPLNACKMGFSVVRNTKLNPWRLEFQSCFCCLLSLWLWINPFTSPLKKKKLNNDYLIGLLPNSLLYVNMLWKLWHVKWLYHTLLMTSYITLCLDFQNLNTKQSSRNLKHENKLNGYSLENTNLQGFLLFLPQDPTCRYEK